MKKSRLLHNPKDLLSRSFNPAKCKTSLRLAGSRLKLLRNKKEVQLKQMNREIAQLLESGQDQTARIRVEHVIREEKMMAAYDLLEIYCELAVARLPIIESQKNCPIDLKEAIASLVFAAPGCGDVPELLDVRKQITSKYGKDFTTAATELRPQCGVGRMLIEKLSATAPNGQTKLKFLSAIAEGHNVKWDPKSFGDKDYVSQNDPQGEPSSLTKESEQYAKPPHFEAAQGQARPNNNNVMMQTSPSNFSLQDDRTSVAPEKLVSALTAVRVYTVCDESKYLIVRNVPSLGCGGELLKVFSTYGQIEECKPMDAEECEMYTDVYWIKFHQVSNARFAKRKLDESVFLGNRIRVSYAPEYESLSDTKEKLDGRRKEVLARLNPRRSKGPSDSPNEPSSVPTPSVAQQLKEPEIAATRQTSSNILPSNHNQKYFPLESMNRTVHLVREKLNKIQYSVGNTEPASSKRICVHNRRRI